MSIGASILPEFDLEMATTRKLLERIPDDKFDWKPHEKSGTMGWLANHLVNIPGWTMLSIKQDSLDLAGSDEPPKEKRSREELLNTFDQNVAAARDTIAGVSDEELSKQWSLLKGDETLLTMPKITVLRGFVMSHLIHHRGQLCVYLRLNDVPVPSIYGPSADEEAF